MSGFISRGGRRLIGPLVVVLAACVMVGVVVMRASLGGRRARERAARAAFELSIDVGTLPSRDAFAVPA